MFSVTLVVKNNNYKQDGNIQCQTLCIERETLDLFNT